MAYRLERDVLGSVKVPKDAYYGSETQRAVENFQISGILVEQEFIAAYAELKRAAAAANMAAGKLDARKGRAIARACTEIMKGRLREEFVVDVFQAGAGTSTNMNLNEVIANRAIEILGGRRGNYRIVHPNDDVNMSQSTNDTFHTVMHISSYRAVREKLLPAMEGLEKALGGKAKSFRHIIKTGRTHLQDAVPIRLGQEFSGYEGGVASVRKRVEESANHLLAIPLGGTAVGTGINAGIAYQDMAIRELNKSTGYKFRKSESIFTSMQNPISELALAGSLAESSIMLGKIANDFRLLASGPRTGIGELFLPEVQPGSSIMPGKVNPSMAEMLNMVCFQVIGNSESVRHAVGAGQLELNVFMPVIAYNLLFSIRILSNGIAAFRMKCVDGIKANEVRTSRNLEMDISRVTALNPVIGYENAAKIARKAYLTGKSVREIALEEGVVDGKEIDRYLDPERMV